MLCLRFPDVSPVITISGSGLCGVSARRQWSAGKTTEDWSLGRAILVGNGEVWTSEILEMINSKLLSFLDEARKSERKAYI